MIRMEEKVNMIKFVKATPEDVDHLRSLAHKSESHWGYDNTFMDVYDSKFNITEKFILDNPVYVIWKNVIPIAFWGLKYDFGKWELEYFYVAKRYLGKGYGKQMWHHMTNWCKEHKIRKIHFVTSYQAVGFYEKMGAIQEDVSQSMIDGRPIPHFIYEI